MFTITTRTSWNLKRMLSIDEDGPTFSFDATNRFQRKGKLYVRLHLFCDQVESRQPQEQYATYLLQVELFMKIPTAECNNERRRKNLSKTLTLQGSNRMRALTSSSSVLV